MIGWDCGAMTEAHKSNLMGTEPPGFPVASVAMLKQRGYWMGSLHINALMISLPSKVIRNSPPGSPTHSISFSPRR